MACRVILALVPIVLLAQEGSTPRIDQGAKRMMRSSDTIFAIETAQRAVAEMEMGRLAAEKAGSADVKAFAKQMIEDHGKANDRLRSIVEKQNLTLPTTMNAKQQALYDLLKAKSGADFDKAYVDDLVKDHEQEVKRFEQEANKGKDDQIKAFASETLPVIQSHLEKIKAIQANI